MSKGNSKYARKLKAALKGHHSPNSPFGEVEAVAKRPRRATKAPPPVALRPVMSTKESMTVARKFNRNPALVATPNFGRSGEAHGVTIKTKPLTTKTRILDATEERERRRMLHEIHRSRRPRFDGRYARMLRSLMNRSTNTDSTSETDVAPDDSSM